MIRVIAVSVALIGILAGCGSKKESSKSNPVPAQENHVFGRWSAEDIESGNIKFRLHVLIEPGKLTNIVECIFANNAIVKAQTTAKASINETTVKALENTENTVNENGNKCTARISNFSVTYRLEKDKLHLSDGRTEKMLTRVQ